MPDLNTDGQAAIPRGGMSGVALELLASGARAALRAPLGLLRVPLLGVQQACSVTATVWRGSTEVTERGLALLSMLRSAPETAPPSMDQAGYLAEPPARNGEYAEFSPDFASDLDAGVLDPVGSGPVSDADADLIAELGTDIGADLDPAADAVLAAELLAEPADSRMTDADLEAAAADLAAVDEPPPAPAAGVVNTTPAAPAVDIVTRAAVAAEAAADDALPDIDRDELPIADFDHVTAGSLRGRLRRLDLAELATLRTYEQEHGRRLPILTLLENRIAKLEAAGAS